MCTTELMGQYGLNQQKPAQTPGAPTTTQKKKPLTGSSSADVLRRPLIDRQQRVTLG